MNRYLVDGLNGCELDQCFEGNQVISIMSDKIQAPLVHKAFV